MTKREGTENTISRRGLYLDSKEWEKLGVLGKDVELDYRSLFGGTVQTMHGTEVIKTWKSKPGKSNTTMIGKHPLGIKTTHSI